MAGALFFSLWLAQHVYSSEFSNSVTVAAPLRFPLRALGGTPCSEYPPAFCSFFYFYVSRLPHSLRKGPPAAAVAPEELSPFKFDIRMEGLLPEEFMSG